MIRRGKSAAFLNGLHGLYPDTMLSVVTERIWCSLTFTGVQLCLSFRCPETADPDDLSDLARILATHDFDLKQQFVADIGLRQDDSALHADAVLVDVLLLDE